MILFITRFTAFYFVLIFIAIGNQRIKSIPTTLIHYQLDTSLDYLIGLSELRIDTHLSQRLKEITSLSDDDRKQLYAVVDALLRDYKTKK